MPATYEAIATTTLGSAAATITFSSISSAYTDLKLIFVYKGTTTAGARLRINNDTSTLYSYQYASASRTSAIAGLTTTTDVIPTHFSVSAPTTTFATLIVDFIAYTGSTNKQMLLTTNMDQGSTTGEVNRMASLYRSTSAINRIDLFRTGGNYDIGSTATLYGILKA